MAREWIDSVCRAGIKLILLTGVAFTVTACYGVPSDYRYAGEPEYGQDKQKMEQQLESGDADENAETTE